VGKSHLYEANNPKELEKKPSSQPPINALSGSLVNNFPISAGTMRNAMNAEIGRNQDRNNALCFNWLI
jgi:hypothetical protein